MYSGIPYGVYLDCPQCRVSLDNVRLKFSYKYKNYDFDKHEAVPSIDLFSRKIDQLFFHDCDIKWSHCDFFKIGNYARTCTISGIDPSRREWSCAVMFGRYVFDASCKQIAPEIVFDCNPNKVPSAIFSQVVFLLRDSALRVEIIRYDVAFDFPVDRNFVTLIPNDRQGYKLFRDSSKGTTEYQGERSHHNAMKLYDKTKESSLSVPVTRCEITIGGDYTGSISNLFPALTQFTNLQLDMSLVDAPFPVYACMIHPDLIPVLKARSDPKTWRKYKGLLTEYSAVPLSPSNWKEIDHFVRTSLYRLKGGAL